MGVKGLETIGMLVRTLIVIAVLAVVLDMLLPQNQFRTYLKMVMGLLVIVAVLQVVGQALDEEWLADLPALALPLGSTEQENKTIMEEGKRVSSENAARAMEEYKKGLAKQVSALAGLQGDFVLAKVQVEVQEDASRSDFGQLQGIVLEVKDKDRAKGQEDRIQVAPVDVVSVSTAEDTNVQTKEIPAGTNPVMDKMAQTVANFYNLTPEKVKVVMMAEEQGGRQ